MCTADIALIAQSGLFKNIYSFQKRALLCPLGLYCSKRATTNSMKKIFLLVSKIFTSKEHTSAGLWSLSDPAEDREKKGVGGMRELVAVVFHWLHLTVDAHSGSSFLHDWNISKGCLWGRFSAILYCSKPHWIFLSCQGTWKNTFVSAWYPAGFFLVFFHPSAKVCWSWLTDSKVREGVQAPTDPPHIISTYCPCNISQNVEWRQEGEAIKLWKRVVKKYLFYIKYI